MDWEVINGITGLISAICAVLSIGYIYNRKHSHQTDEQQTILTANNAASFIIACSGWTLCCLSFLWVVEPFGRYPTAEEYQQFYGVIIAFPALVLFRFGVLLLQDRGGIKPIKTGE